ncbi:MAG: hypothetical protein OEM62_06435 [Acidobacteriota bacterium]|nr:hypothetical protein [Acidobacteriota bacterium]
MYRALTAMLFAIAWTLPAVTEAYPPAVGIVGQSRDCLSCHANNGPWADETQTILDIIDAASGESLRLPDGKFLIDVERGRTRRVLTLIGRRAEDKAPAPLRNAWLYVDPAQIGTGSLSKFAPGWSVNLPMACRIVGDKVDAYPAAAMTSLPMTVRPGDTAQDARLELQVMLTAGESAKGSPNTWLQGNYLVREVRLRVIDP